MKNTPLLALYKIFLFILISIIGCSPASKTEKDTSIQERNVAWDESDSESVADSLVLILLQAEWNKNFSQKNKPIIVVGKIDDNSNENIDTSLLAKYLERSLLNSGKVSFIADKQKRENIRNHRKNRADFTDNIQFIKYLKLLKANFFLDGELNLSIDSSAIQTQKTYKLDVELLNTKDASIVWQDRVIINK